MEGGIIGEGWRKVWFKRKGGGGGREWDKEKIWIIKWKKINLREGRGVERIVESTEKDKVFKREEVEERIDLLEDVKAWRGLKKINGL